MKTGVGLFVKKRPLKWVLSLKTDKLNNKRDELNILEEKLAERELELTGLSAELRGFEANYLGIVGIRYAKLDEILARIAEAQARLHPTDNIAAKRVTEQRNRAQESAKATSDIRETPLKGKLQSSENLNKLYRNVARKIHPDLCTNETERLQREKLMTEANLAYEEGNEERLQQILNEWESSPESVSGEDIGAELVRILRKIAQVEDRLNTISSEIEKLHKSDLYQLKTKVDSAAADKRDLLNEMADRLDNEIAKAEKKLKEIVKTYE